MSLSARNAVFGTIFQFNQSNPTMSNFLKILALSALTLAVTRPTIAQSAKPAMVKRPSWIALQAQTDKQQYAAGEPIKVTLKATNIQRKDAYLKFSSGQRFDLKVFRVGERESVYTWSANKTFMMAIAHIKLKQGESASYEGEIGSDMGELGPGSYRMEAQMSNSSQISAAPVSFTIGPRAASMGATQTATTDKRVYDIGEEVEVNFTLQNNANAPMTFDFNSGQTYDVFVRNAAGDLVWNWSANKRFTMAMRKVTLAAGEKQDFSVKWDGRALPDYRITPGKYKVEAVFVATPEVRAAPIEIEFR